jgi:hypothetical protein
MQFAGPSNYAAPAFTSMVLSSSYIGSGISGSIDAVFTNDQLAQYPTGSIVVNVQDPATGKGIDLPLASDGGNKVNVFMLARLSTARGGT